MSHIVKRAGHREKYESRKVYASVYAACLTVRVHPGEAELIADKVTKELNAWATEKNEMTSSEIFQQIVFCLQKYNSDAAYMYKTHRDLS